jgi:hypothetical protein
VIKANLHNLVMVVVMAVLGFLALKLANRTFLANVPGVGSVLQLAEQAA